MSPELVSRIINGLDRLGKSDANPADMLSALRELDVVVKEHGAALPGDLRHYLERRSYEKARMYLAGASGIPAGACGRGQTAVS